MTVPLGGCINVSPEAAFKPVSKYPMRVLRMKYIVDPPDIAWKPIETVGRLAGAAIAGAGISTYAFDCPYPCGPCEGFCERITYPEGTSSAAIDAVAARLAALGVLLGDEPYRPPLTHYAGELPGQEALF